MNKFTTLLLFTLLLMNVQSFAADNAQPVKDSAASRFDAAVKDDNFEDFSYNVSDEQLQESVDISPIEEEAKSSFWSKVVNSGHFSSGTATKTYIPINNAQ